jgi:Tol biopolymer transport system component
MNRHLLRNSVWKYVYRSPRDVEALDVSPDGIYVAFVENYEGFSRLYVPTVDFSEVVLVDAPQGVAKVRNRTSVYAEVVRFIAKHTLSAETG